jgi:hypothetical protein
VSTDLAGTGDQTLDSTKDPADRSILIGVVATVLFHVLLAVFSPQFSFTEFSGVHTGITVNNTNRGQTFDFELTPPDVPEKQPAPAQFVETNPDAPENEPDKTSNFSNRNQQSAQKEAPKEIDPLNRPSISDAQDKIKNDLSIVTGDLSKPQLGAAARPETAQTNDQQEQNEQRLRMLQAPDAGFEKVEGKSEEGISSNISQTKAPSTHASQDVEGAPDGKEADGSLVAVTEAHKAQPKARPRLTAPRTTILTNRPAGTRNLGIVGMDARWSEYGEYIQELVEIIQIQWYRILDESRVSPPRGSHVTITFKINSKGETDIVKVEDSDAGKQGVFTCQNAIQARQPYRKWTEQMIALLGDEQELTFAFYYQ